MTTLDDIKNIAKAEESEDKEEKPVEEKKAEEDDKKDDKDETNKAILEALKYISERLDKSEKKQEEMQKAMETPTDLPQSPKGTADSEDVGDKVTAPKDPYPTGDQAGLHDDKTGEDKPESDKGDLKMQEKSVDSHVTSPVERPTTNVSKSTTGQEDLLPFQILQKCRSTGFENLSLVGKELLGIAEKYDKEGEL